jgi:formamidopyrimidine-DNA glycosylase
MPELPEVETIVRSLRPRLSGLKISTFGLLFRPILRNENRNVLKKLRGRKIRNLARRGKMILVHCEKNLTLIFHLKMTGQLLFCSKREPLDKHAHFILNFKGHSRELRFCDVRKFGFVSCVQTSDVLGCPELKSLGPEPLEISFQNFLKLFQNRKARLKSLLLNQNFIAGIGNIYADEILFEARLHPLTPASSLMQGDIRRLWRATRHVLKRAIAERGSTIRDYRNSEGEEGNFQNFLKVYGRSSLCCRRCGEKIVRFRLGQRSTFFCPRCQKKN